jgi:phosphoesterase RecJ-like protein
LGGGGHENASGCTLDGPLERAREQILAELRPAVAKL